MPLESNGFHCIIFLNRLLYKCRNAACYKTSSSQATLNWKTFTLQYIFLIRSKHSTTLELMPIKRIQTTHTHTHLSSQAERQADTVPPTQTPTHTNTHSIYDSQHILCKGYNGLHCGCLGRHSDWDLINPISSLQSMCNRLEQSVPWKCVWLLQINFSITVYRNEQRKDQRLYY